jgi:shikimate dehydrogenase
MTGVNAQFEDLSFLDHLPAHAPVCDLIYSPSETLFLEQARLRGHQTLNGLNMLIWQAIFALEQFTNTRIDGSAMVQALKPVLTP